MGDRVNAAIDEALQRAYVAKLFDCAEYMAEDILPLPSIRAITAKYTVLPGPDETGYRPYYLRQIFSKAADVCALQGQKALLSIMGRIVVGGLPRHVMPFYCSWTLSVLVNVKDGAERLVNAPFNLARAAYGCLAFDDKSMWAGELEPFSVSGGTSGSSEVLACIDLAMKQLAPRHWARFKLDFISFY